MGSVRKASEIVTSHYSHYFSKEKKVVTSHYSDYKPKETSLTSQINTKRNKREYTRERAQRKADDIASALNNPSRRMFYLKCAWNLTDTYLDRLLKISLAKTDAARYFSAAAANEMRHNS